MDEKKHWYRFLERAREKNRYQADLNGETKQKQTFDSNGNLSAKCICMPKFCNFLGLFQRFVISLVCSIFVFCFRNNNDLGTATFFSDFLYLLHRITLNELTLYKSV